MFSDPQKNIEQFHVDPGMKVADLGSGSGFYSFAVSDAVGRSGAVYAVEIQKDLLARLKNEARASDRGNIKTILGDFETTGGSTLSESLVDRVLLTNTLFQTEDKSGALKEAYRILKPKGRLLIVDWTDSHGGLGPHPDEVLREDDARRLAEDAGFKYEREINAGDHHYGMIFSKNI